MCTAFGNSRYGYSCHCFILTFLYLCHYLTACSRTLEHLLTNPFVTRGKNDINHLVQLPVMHQGFKNTEVVLTDKVVVIGTQLFKVTQITYQDKIF